MPASFRGNADPGVWCSILVPAAIFVSTSDLSTLSLASTLAACSVFEAYRQSLAFETGKKKPFSKAPSSSSDVAIVLLAGTLQAAYLPLNKALINAVSLWLFELLLPRLFVTFPKSFTFGEGCLALQSFVIFVSKSTNIFTIEAIDTPRHEQASYIGRIF